MEQLLKKVKTETNLHGISLFTILTVLFEFSDHQFDLGVSSFANALYDFELVHVFVFLQIVMLVMIRNK